MMGICVVYLVENADGYALMDLSVAQLKRFTVGHTVSMGAVQTMTSKPSDAWQHVIQDVGGERLSHVSHEHSKLLNLLLNQAVQDGCTQIATFDMESWPILPNWRRRHL